MSCFYFAPFTFLPTSSRQAQMKHPLPILLLIAFIASHQLHPSSSASFQQKPKYKTVIFVCEHGVAKSIIAASYFNKIAKEQKLPFRAIARSTAPQDSLMQSVIEGLRRDNLPPPTHVAPKLTQTEFDVAKRAVFFCPLPTSYFSRSSTREWNDIPPVSQQYQAARDSIVVKIRILLDELARE